MSKYLYIHWAGKRESSLAEKYISVFPLFSVTLFIWLHAGVKNIYIIIKLLTKYFYVTIIQLYTKNKRTKYPRNFHRIE